LSFELFPFISLLVKSFKSLDFLLLYRTLILLIFFHFFLNFIKVLCNPLILLLKNCLDKPLGASPLLALCYPPYGIGSGIGGSLQVSPGSSPVGGLVGGLGSSLGSRLWSWLGSRLGSKIGSGLGSRLGGRLGGSLGGYLGGSLGGRLGSHLESSSHSSELENQTY